MSEFEEIVVVATNGVLDLGAVSVPLLEGLEISVNMDQETMQGTGLGLTYGASMADIQVFARAKDELIWPTTRDELVSALAQQQVDCEIVIGVFGSEIHCTMPAVDFENNNVLQPVRFLGVDGDRWFMRIAVSGAAAVDPADMEQMDVILSQLTVHRGAEAMSPGEPLTLTLPK